MLVIISVFSFGRYSLNQKYSNRVQLSQRILRDRVYSRPKLLPRSTQVKARIKNNLFLSQFALKIHRTVGSTYFPQKEQLFTSPNKFLLEGNISENIHFLSRASILEVLSFIALLNNTSNDAKLRQLQSRVVYVHLKSCSTHTFVHKCPLIATTL